jgi:hypothetical protein
MTTLVQTNMYIYIVYTEYPDDEFMTKQPGKFHKHDLIIELAAFI